MTCLLCPSAAVADCLCVPCGAKLWAAKLAEKDPRGFVALSFGRFGLNSDVLKYPNANEEGRKLSHERHRALDQMSDPNERARLFRCLDAAKAARAAQESRNARERDDSK